jgi:hypothetical protein
MMTALILVCSLAAFPDLRGCTRENALEVLHVPATFETPVTCLLHGQAYLAQTSIGRGLNETEAVKVICVRNRPLAG